MFARLIISVVLSLLLFPLAGNTQVWEELGSPRVIGYISTLHADSRGNLFAAGYSHAYRSTDDGSSWAIVSIDGNPVKISSMTIDSSDFIYLLAYRTPLTDGMVMYVSSDGGNTWTAREKAKHILYSFSNGDLISTGSWKAYEKSTDHGVTWDSVSHRDNEYLSGISDEGKLYGYYYDTIYISPDLGGTWHTLTSPVSNLQQVLLSRGMVYASNGYDAYASRGTSGSWQLLEFPSSFFQFMFYPAHDGVLLGRVINSSYIYRSIDSGRTWTEYDSGIPIDVTFGTLLPLNVDRQGRALITDGMRIFRTRRSTASVTRRDRNNEAYAFSMRERTVTIRIKEGASLLSGALTLEVHDLLGRKIEAKRVEQISSTAATVQLPANVHGTVALSLTHGGVSLARSFVNVP